ncbi:zeta toxin family protein [Bifidobacterium callitrichidarum]|nr:zeta toxin family protein [Bifidobacterium callitrichidarum]
MWDEQIKQVVFEDYQPSDNPLTVFLGGQSGAGKTQGVHTIMGAYRDEGLVYINPDDYRQFHPDYDKLMEERPLDMPKRTARASAVWTDLAVETADNERYSTIVEGTWNNVDRVLQQMQEAKDCGRRVHAAALATPPTLSRLAVLERYYRDLSMGRPARWVSPDFHDKIVESLPDKISMVADSGIPDRFIVVDRKDGLIPYSADESEDFLNEWNERFQRPLSVEEAEMVYEHAERIRENISDIDPDNEEAKRAVLSLYDEPTIFRIHPIGMPEVDSRQPRKPNGEYDFKN